MRGNSPLAEGYHIFRAIADDDKGYEIVAAEVESQIKAAEKDFDIVFLSGPSYKDDPGARAVSFCSQAAVLTRKRK
jgi:hypothetical protein